MKQTLDRNIEIKDVSDRIELFKGYSAIASSMASLFAAVDNKPLAKAATIASHTFNGISAASSLQLATTTGASMLAFGNVLGAAVGVIGALIGGSDNDDSAAILHAIEMLYDAISQLREDFAEFRHDLFLILGNFFEIVQSYLTVIIDQLKRQDAKADYHYNQLSALHDYGIRQTWNSLASQMEAFGRQIPLNTLTMAEMNRLAPQAENLLLVGSTDPVVTGEHTFTELRHNNLPAVQGDIERLLLPNDPLRRVFGFALGVARRVTGTSRTPDSIINPTLWRRIAPSYLTLRHGPHAYDPQQIETQKILSQGKRFLDFIARLEDSAPRIMAYFNREMLKAVQAIMDLQQAFEHTVVTEDVLDHLTEPQHVELQAQDLEELQSVWNMSDATAKNFTLKLTEKTDPIPQIFYALEYLGLGKFVHLIPAITRRAPLWGKYGPSDRKLLFIETRDSVQIEYFDGRQVTIFGGLTTTYHPYDHRFSLGGCEPSCANLDCYRQRTNHVTTETLHDATRMLLQPRHNATQYILSQLDIRYDAWYHGIVGSVLQTKAILLAVGAPRALLEKILPFDFEAFTVQARAVLEADLRHEDVYRSPVNMTDLAQPLVSYQARFKATIEHMTSLLRTTGAHHHPDVAAVRQIVSEYQLFLEGLTIHAKAEAKQAQRTSVVLSQATATEPQRQTAPAPAPQPETDVRTLLADMQQQMRSMQQKMQQFLVSQPETSTDEPGPAPKTDAASAAPPQETPICKFTPGIGDEMTCRYPVLQVRRHIRRLPASTAPMAHLQYDHFEDGDCIVLEGHVPRRQCTAAHSEFIEETLNHPGFAFKLMQSCINSAKEAFAISFVVELLSDFLLLMRMLTAKQASQLKLAVNILLVSYVSYQYNSSLVLLSTAASMAVTIGLKQVQVPDKMSMIASRMTSYFVNHGAIFKPEAIAQAVSSFAGSELGLFAKKKLFNAVGPAVREAFNPAAS